MVHKLIQAARPCAVGIKVAEVLIHAAAEVQQLQHGQGPGEHSVRVAGKVCMARERAGAHVHAHNITLAHS